MMEENKHNYDVYWNDVSIFKFTVCKKKNRPVFFPRPFRPCCQLSILRLGKFQCFKLSLFDYICV